MAIGKTRAGASSSSSSTSPARASSRSSSRSPLSGAKASAGAKKDSYTRPPPPLLDLAKSKPFGIDPKRIVDLVKAAVKNVQRAFTDIQNIAKEYDPELAARAGLEGVIHTGTDWLAKNVPIIGKPVSELVDRIFNKPPPKAEWPSPPPPVSANPPLDGDLKGSTYRNTDGVPLYGPGGPKLPGDVRQKGLGDCYFMASMAGLTPDQVKDMIRDNKDGTYTVRLYDVSSDGKVTPAFVTVNGDLPDPPGADYGKDGKWAAIVEKAYAAHLGSYDVAAGNNNPKFFAAPTVLTGRTTVAYALPLSDPGIVFDRLQRSTADGRPAFAGFYGPNHDGLYGNHAYTVESVRVDPATGQRYVTLRNPWGHSELGQDGQPKDGVNDGVFEVTLEDFMKTYQAVAVAGG